MELQTICNVPVSEFRKSVLVIDDCTEALYLGRVILEKDGFHVTTSSSGTEALNILETMSAPDIVLLDMQMSDMSGSTFLENLKIRLPDFLSQVPVVFYSASEEAPLGNAIGFIRKAGNISQFLQQVNSFARVQLPVIAPAAI
jgi:CheY-like chemotaxis protein